MKKDKFDIYGMTCASCKAHVDKAVKKIKGVNEVNISLLLNTMDVTYDENLCSIVDIEKAVKKSGYKAKIASKDGSIRRTKDKRIDIDLIKLISSFVILLMLLYISMGPHFSDNWPLPHFIDINTNPLWYSLAQLILTLPICIIYGNYFVSGFKKLFTLKPSMDSLIALGASASLIYGVYAIFQIGFGNTHYVHELYFESAATILTLVSLGKYFEKLSKKRTTNAISKLVKMTPKTSLVLIEGEEKEINSEDIKVNDIVIIKKGDVLAIDGIIEEGKGSLEESNITGESIPKFKKEGEEVFSSSTLISGYLKVKATRVNEDTSINTIARLVNEAANSKAPISKLVDKISLFFVPIIILIAIITFVVFISTGYEFSTALNFAISTLVIACPCALGLATPVAIMVATGKGAELELIIENAEILEKAHLIKTVVFDKTGTLTEGKPSITDFIQYKEDKNLGSIIFSLEKLSSHPLGDALSSYFSSSEELKIENYESKEGEGIKGVFNGDLYQIGNKRIIKKIDKKKEKIYEKFSNEGKTTLFVTKNDEIVALLALRDEIKESSLIAIEELKKKNIEIVMLTGDNEKVALAIAKEAGITKVISDVLPLRKAEIVSSLKKDKKHLVAMVGDGVNDALALSTADLGIAIGKGSDVAIESSDIILKRNDLRDVLNVISLSKRTLITIATNLFWAFIYNVIGILIATGIFYPAFGLSLTPMIASLAMSFSSVFVVLNALTLNLFKLSQRKKGNK